MGYQFGRNIAVIGTANQIALANWNGQLVQPLKAHLFHQDSNKMYIQFSKIISKKEKISTISAYAISSDGSAGIPAEVNNNIGNEVINFLTNQLVSNQTNDVGRIVLDKSVGQTELGNPRNVSVKKGSSPFILMNRCSYKEGCEFYCVYVQPQCL